MEPPDSPEAPVHLNNAEASAWQSGWEAGFKAGYEKGFNQGQWYDPEDW
jgi:hypothetical protein